MSIPFKIKFISQPVSCTFILR